jgi:hypothetical protein
MTNPNDSATGFAWSQEQSGTSGLTKREYFAAMAMQGLLSNPNTIFETQYAVIIADALIAELNKKTNNDTPNN